MKQVGEKRSTVDTHMDAYCLLKNTSTKHNNKKLEHFDDISVSINRSG
jgi:hypothetical protein